jgi:hypothetical protein
MKKFYVLQSGAKRTRISDWDCQIRSAVIKYVDSQEGIIVELFTEVETQVHH